MYSVRFGRPRFLLVFGASSAFYGKRQKLDAFNYIYAGGILPQFPLEQLLQLQIHQFGQQVRALHVRCTLLHWQKAPHHLFHKAPPKDHTTLSEFSYQETYEKGGSISGVRQYYMND
jgi:hypothetical protein